MGASHKQTRSVWVHCWLLASTAGAGRASSRSKLPLHVVSSAHPTVVSGRDGSVSPAASPPPSPKGAGGVEVDPVALARQAFAGVCLAKWVYAYASVGVCLCVRKRPKTVPVQPDRLLSTLCIACSLCVC